MPSVRRFVSCVLLLVAVAGVTLGASPRRSGDQLAANYSGALPDSRQSMRATHVYRDEDSQGNIADVLPLPGNIAVSGEIQAVVARMLRASPTFRRQCLRLANADSLSVTIARAIPSGEGSRASTHIVLSPEGRLHAAVRIGPSGDAAELVAHEFEHIIEQLDGVDLPELAKRPGTGVRAIGDTLFETDRANSVGRQVADELHAFGE
jgi:hypothetical protein